MSAPDTDEIHRVADALDRAFLEYDSIACGDAVGLLKALAEMPRDLADARRERDEARAWVRRLTAKGRVLTCVYCGEAYPPGSPTHGAEVLTAHVKVCAKHPMREALDIIRTLLASAYPHPVEHPTMSAAWTKARAFLGETLTPDDQPAEAHNHFGEVFMPKTCPACASDDADPDGHAADDAANARLGQ